ncbi:AAA family ATPase [Photobacterium damselae]|uniref:AAA family ATPase n=1 Tax=Photobacterium damselae TaxID=38293 RepID=UPI004067750D
MIKSISFTRILNNNQISIPFNNDVSIIVGANGCGKTTVIDAIHKCLRGQEQNSALVDGVALNFNEQTPLNTLTISPLNFNHQYLKENQNKWRELFKFLTDNASVKCELESILSKVFDCETTEINQDVFFIVNKGVCTSYNITNTFHGIPAIMLAFAFAIVAKNNPEESITKPVFLFDQIDISIHLAIQTKVINYLLKTNPKLQIIGATHSPALIMSLKNELINLSDISKY